jgi:dihydrofolate reductase
MRYEIHGYAVVSADDRIADADGCMPIELRNEADWIYFQGELDRAALTVLGRLTHDAAPNERGRRRLVLSSKHPGLEQRQDAWWCNPAQVPIEQALAAAGPGGGRIAVIGGMRVFDLFLATGYDLFHLTRVRDARLPGGQPLFSAVQQGLRAEEILAQHGLVAADCRVLDETAEVTLTVWCRSQQLSSPPGESALSRSGRRLP